MPDHIMCVSMQYIRRYRGHNSFWGDSDSPLGAVLFFALNACSFSILPGDIWLHLSACDSILARSVCIF